MPVELRELANVKQMGRITSRFWRCTLGEATQRRPTNAYGPKAKAVMIMDECTPMGLRELATP